MMIAPNVKDPRPAPHVLLVQAAAHESSALQESLESHGFVVTPKTTVKDALQVLASEPFIALISDLEMPCAGDGFTLVNAMRHLHPQAITILLSEFAALRESLIDLLPQADEVLVTPISHREVVRLLVDRLKDPKHRPANHRLPVAAILERHAAATIREWLKRVNASKELSKVRLTGTARTGHLAQLLKEVIARLRTPHVDEGSAVMSRAAVSHGMARRYQGYTAEMLVQESRILQVCIFRTLRTNLNAVDLALVLTDVMTIADEVDSQLTQTMASFIAGPEPVRRRALKAAS